MYSRKRHRDGATLPSNLYNIIRFVKLSWSCGSCRYFCELFRRLSVFIFVIICILAEIPAPTSIWKLNDSHIFDGCRSPIVRISYTTNPNLMKFTCVPRSCSDTHIDHVLCIDNLFIRITGIEWLLIKSEDENFFRSALFLFDWQCLPETWGMHEWKTFSHILFRLVYCCCRNLMKKRFVYRQDMAKIIIIAKRRASGLCFVHVVYGGERALRMRRNRNVI